MGRPQPTRTGSLVATATLGAVLLGALPLLRGEFDLESARAAARFTARWSFCWFLVTFSASSLALLWPGASSEFLSRERRGFGLGFAAAHLVHAGFFLTAMLAFEMPVSAVTLVGGSVAYLVVLAMAFTSNERSREALGRVAWSRWHRAGSAYLVLIFAFTYLGRISPKPWVAFSGLGALSVALLLRARAHRVRRGADRVVTEKPREGCGSSPS